MLATALTQSLATRRVWRPKSLAKARPSRHATTSAIYASVHRSRTSADALRKLPSSSLATAATEAMLEFLEIAACGRTARNSTLTEVLVSHQTLSTPENGYREQYPSGTPQ